MKSVVKFLGNLPIMFLELFGPFYIFYTELSSTWDLKIRKLETYFCSDYY